jgi:inosine-uridine nucleoside N-ribohydrolase
MKKWMAGMVIASALFCMPLAAQQKKIIFDTDFVYPPQDDAMALIFVLNCPEIQILGITTVVGNKNVEIATADALKILEVVGRSEIPVYKGAARPFKHEKTEWDTKKYGGWWSNEPPQEREGGFAKKKAESRNAVDYLISTVMQNPGQITILGLGPLTNIAMAMMLEPNFAKNVKELVIMGGGVASLPDGGGNHTPQAEYNFYVDPEAAKIVLRSGIPIVLSPLNVSRKAKFTKEWYEKVVAVDTPITRLVKLRLGPTYEKYPDRSAFMYDQIAAVTLVAPELMKTVEMYVDVDDHWGPSYGASIGGKEIWPGAEGAQKMQVQYDLDWDKFIRLYVERVTRKTAKP